MPEPRTTRTQQATTLAKAMTAQWNGHDLAVLGAALAQALAIFLVSHPEATRDRLLDNHTASVRKFMKVAQEMKQKAQN